jgi:preprotein translocase subunit SecF
MLKIKVGRCGVSTQQMSLPLHRKEGMKMINTRTTLYRLMSLGPIVALAFFGLAVLSTPALAGFAGVIATCAYSADRIALLCVSKTRVLNGILVVSLREVAP